MYCMHFCGDKEIIDWLNLPLLYYGVNSQGEKDNPPGRSFLEVISGCYYLPFGEYQYLLPTDHLLQGKKLLNTIKFCQ